MTTENQPAETQVAAEPDKVAKKPRAKRAAGAVKKQAKKRGPARPYRKLSAELLDGRIAKLQKRVARATEQLQESRGFLTKYEREKEFRTQPEDPDAPGPAVEASQ